MIYNDFQDLTLSRLGFGTMRLPVREDKSIDEEQTARMIDYALSHGVNYFDTAWPYHGGRSELVVGKILSRYPRESWYLASKYPGHQISDSYDPAAVFEEQLRKCGVEYFDFYLLHNVYENDIDVYCDPKWGIVDYFVEQRRLGRIRHLGFSSHARPDTLKRFLDLYGEQMEFCQIQLNYLDWTLQGGKEKYDMLTERGIPVWVMEPIRGGRLARLGEREARLRALRPDESASAWALRWLMDLPNVKMILSGMSDMAQMEENVRTFSEGERLNDTEKEALLALAEELKDAVPCTTCRYCIAGCPQQLDIPMLIAAYNDIRFDGGMTVGMQMDALPEDKLPSACIGCGACTGICPQHIEVDSVMSEFADLLARQPRWADVCREREEAQRALEQEQKNG